jgi:hypothetical protein
VGEGYTRTLDPMAGRLMDYLKSQGLAENTLIIAMADNGPNLARLIPSSEDCGPRCRSLIGCFDTNNDKLLTADPAGKEDHDKSGGGFRFTDEVYLPGSVALMNAPEYVDRIFEHYRSVRPNCHAYECPGPICGMFALDNSDTIGGGPLVECT